MRNDKQTKQQLIEELNLLRRRVAELEATAAHPQPAESALRESEARLHAAFDSLPFDFWVRDRDQRCILENEASRSHWGSQLGKRPEDGGLEQEALARWQENNRRAYAGEIVQEEASYARPDGPRDYFNIVAPIRVGGEIHGILGFNIDITERKRAEAALRQARTVLEERVTERTAALNAANQQLRAEIARHQEAVEALAQSRQQYRMLIEHSDDIVFSLDPNGLLTYVSPQAARYGFDPAELVSRNFLEVIHPDDQEQMREEFQRTMRTGQEASPSEFRIVGKHGVSWFEERGRVQLAAGDQTGGMIGVLRDITGRKRMEDALCAAYSRLEYLLTSSPGVIYTAKAQGDYGTQFVSANIQAQFGYEAIDFTETPGFWIAHLHPDDAPQALAALSGLSQRGHLTLEYRFRLRDGTYRWMRDEMNLIRDEEGEPQEIVGFWIDISDRKQAEASLQESEERYRDLVELAPDAISVVADGRIVFINSEGARILGSANPEDLIGRPVQQFVHPDRWTWVGDRVTQLLQTGAKIPMVEVAVVRLDGTPIDIEVTATAVSYQGRPAIQTILRDVTERKRIRQALQESEEKYRKLFDNESDALLVYDVQSLLIDDANPAALALFGYTKEEFRALHVGDLSAEKEKTRVSVQNVIDGVPGSQFLSLRQLVKKDGTIFPSEISAASFVAAGRRKVIGAVRDITARMELEHALVQIREREQQRIGQDLHDDLGQQLTGLAFLSKALEQKLAARAPAEAAQAAEIARLASDAVAHTKDLAHSIHPVKLEANGLMTALDALVHNAQRLFRVSCQLECPQPILISDNAAATHLYRIAQEAVTNAVKHGPAKQVRIRLVSTGGQVELTVKDDGRGLPKGLDPGKTLGLQIMNYRAKTIGASLEIRGKPGGGTVVTCRLPVTPPRPDQRH